MKLIDKSALVAEIERRLKVHMESNHGFSARYDELKDILSFLDTLEVKEIGVDLGDPKGDKSAKYIIDPDEMVADFCSQPLSKTRSLASIYRQGIIDIIKRINRNEETSITSTHSIDDGGVQLPKP